jgi:Ca-activated chloride channel homolog
MIVHFFIFIRRQIMKIRWLTKSKKFALGCAYASLAVLVSYGLFARAQSNKKPIPAGPSLATVWKELGKVKVKSSLSQNKVVQGSDGLVYLQVDLEAPEETSPFSKTRKTTDFVVVLDRSGSMADAKKMDYARKAVESLVNQLGSDDRFGLVTFDDIVETPIDLKSVRPEIKENVLSRIRSIEPRGSTNLGGGLLAGVDLLQSGGMPQHARRLILISDGLANVGITDPQELNRIAARAATRESVVSTIGVGLDFNENLMASLADSGTGQYHFLEDLASLDRVLADEFQGASRIYAHHLDVTLDLMPGVQVTEASGYPVTNESGSVRIQPGHLYAGQKKTFFITLHLPTESLYSKPLGEARLSYEVDGRSYTVALFDESLKVACLPIERSQEAMRSIQPGVFKEAWTQNNYGRFLKDNAEKVREGDEGGALSVIRDYKAKLNQAYAASPAPEMKKQLDGLEKMEAEVSGAFRSTDSETSLKRLSKSYQYQGIQNQRKEN